MYFDNVVLPAYNLIKEVWETSLSETSFIKLLNEAIGSSSVRLDNPDNSPIFWAPMLPAVCCQAAGGDPSQTITATAAWILSYMSALTLDGISDGDEPDYWCVDLELGPTLNIATALLLSVPVILNLQREDVSPGRHVSSISKEFFRTLLTISAGQHLDLTFDEIDLKTWWKIAEAKGGSPFLLACKIGAKLGTEDEEIINCLSQFGFHLGLLIQIFDDFNELQTWRNPNNEPELISIDRTLGVVYALEVLPQIEKNKLQNELTLGINDHQVASRVYDTISKCGAPLYLTTEIERHRSKSLNLLDNPRLYKKSKDWLEKLVHEKIPSSVIGS